MSKKELFRFPDAAEDSSPSFPGRLKVAVVPAVSGAGASFVSAQILQSGLLAGETPPGMRTLVELGNAYFYVALGMDKRFKGRSFFDYSSRKKYEKNTELGYNWYLRIPGKPAPPQTAIFRAVALAPGDMIVFDCSGLEGEALLWDVLPEMDIVYLVLDPLPTRLIAAADFIEDMRSKTDCELVVNKFCKGIHRGELSRFLGTSNYHTVDAVPFENICRAEYNCVLPGK